MIRKNKGRYILSLLILNIFLFAVMVSAILASEGNPAFFFGLWLIGTPIVAYLLGMTWQFDLVLRVKEKESTNVEESSEKRKREAIDDVLRDLSDADLVRLKRRLEDGMIDDDLLYEHMVGDDGELVHRK